ncbi:MAG: GAF domain-containing protein [Dehalococcoidia bacterium]|nr:GAF domain-containing protein [Dehalococcoidia bacterium]MCZ7577916.1 GAF domain-containing protein [Dehalococcoidia bacterium]
MTTAEHRQPHLDLEQRLAVLMAEYEQFRYHLPDALLEIAYPSLRVVYMNRVAQVLLRYEEADVEAGINGLDLLTPEGAAEALRIGDSQLEPTVRAGKPYRRQRGQHLYDFTMVCKDGTTFPAEVQGSYVLDEHSMPRGVRFMFRDTTGRMRTAAALERSNGLLAAITDAQANFIRGASPGVVFDSLLDSLLDTTGSEYGLIGEVFRKADGTPYLKTWALTNISWDEASRRLYDERGSTGMEFTNLNSLLGCAITSGEPIIANDPAHHPRRGGMPPGHPPLNAFLGLPVVVSGEVIGLLGIANRPGGYSEQDCADLQPFIATCGTIIEARRNETGRKEAEERLGLALRGADLSIWEWHIPHGRLFTGYRPRNMADAEPGMGGTTLQQWLELVHPGDRPRLEAALADHIAGLTPLIECEHRLSAGPGQWSWVLTRGTVVERDDAGNPVRAAGSFLNINDRKAAEADLSRLEIQARQSQKLESLGVFVGGIAHDFNNLLTAVLGNLYLLQRSLQDGDERELASEAAHAAERGADLVRRLLTYARPELAAGETIALDDLLDETAVLARSMLTPSMRLAVRHSREPGNANGSRTSLQQVLLNLIVNARDAMPEGGRITLARRITDIGPRHRWAPPELPRGRYHVISVSDTGTGMTPDVMERIFDPFFTTKGVGRGSGLGLSTSLGIARAHGGWLTGESTPGAGSTFRLLLPVPE